MFVLFIQLRENLFVGIITQNKNIVCKILLVVVVLSAYMVIFFCVITYMRALTSCTFVINLIEHLWVRT